jgi:hypothetical protein
MSSNLDASHLETSMKEIVISGDFKTFDEQNDERSQTIQNTSPILKSMEISGSADKNRNDTMRAEPQKSLEPTFKVQTKLNAIVSAARVKKIAHYVQIDDINSFRLLGVTKKEIQSLRFDYNMNIL